VLDDCEILARPLADSSGFSDPLGTSHGAVQSQSHSARQTGRPVHTDIRVDLLDAGLFTTLPVEQLLRTEDFSELLRLLEATQFADIARQARVAFETEHDLFAVDATVDRRYFNGLREHALRIEKNQGHCFWN